MKRFFEKQIKKIADGYDPSIGGAIGMISALVTVGGVGLAVVAGGIGALAAGGVGAMWGAGVPLGVAGLIVGISVIPHYIESKCYEYTVRKKVANGGSATGSKWFPGIENLRRNNLSDRKEMMGKAFSRESKKNPKTPNDKNPPKNTPNQPKP